ncbi:type I restriction-modification system methyltransferase subunit [Acinetobacter pittii PHEA-2]|uniref:site-specific DNA-methyltransferase (adenine-specific) n=1 Tax=Acinetobacter pittii (strain PHEA-2) TaxID=871585 RepID=F0KPC1_ACIP2|nr:N-6 DNA methylase [Acinetobacter pittii]YP_004995471.1 type I restriction-modification system methyltransferase subunit [Acinetobacter pittii PHEA-2]ADY81789.1 type I restriction-modification system methyltransferase subunit [Acinetobacter pittii PHEA-2]
MTSFRAANWIAELKRFLSTQSVRELFSVFLLLRWQDVKDEEKQFIAEFEGSEYVPLFPTTLQMRNWADLINPADVIEKINTLASHIERNNAEKFNTAGFGYLKHLHNPLHHIQSIDASLMLPVIQWLCSLQLTPLTAPKILSDIFERILTETRDSNDGEFSSSESLSHLIAELINPKSGESIYDPCFGTGNFLISAWNLFQLRQIKQQNSGNTLQVSGNDINISAFLTGLTKIVLSGVPSTQLTLGNSLDDNSSKDAAFDIVVAHPPVGIKAHSNVHYYRHFQFKSPDITGLFVQQAISRLKTNGRAVIVVPEGFLFRGGADRDLRKHLLTNGMVQAVVGLPTGVIISGSNIRGCLLVLNKNGNFHHVQMVDAKNLKGLRAASKASSLFQLDAEKLSNLILGQDYREREDSSSRSYLDETSIQVDEDTEDYVEWRVSVPELAETDWDLTPRRRERNELLNALKPFTKASDTSYVDQLSTISSIFLGRTIKAVDLTSAPHNDQAKGYIRISDLAHGKIVRMSRWLKPDAPYNSYMNLQPGDILISRSGTIGKNAIVSEAAAGALAGQGLYVIRPDKNYLDSDYLLAYINSRACQNWFSAHARGTAIQNINRDTVLKLPIPVLPLPIQRRAVARYQQSGTDILTFISTLANNSEMDTFSSLVLEVESQLPRFVPGVESTPSLDLLEPIVDLVRNAQKYPLASYSDERVARSLFFQAVSSLEDVGKIPPGPGLLNILQESERVLFSVNENLANNDTPLRFVTERLRVWLKAAIADLLVPVKLKLLNLPVSLPAESYHSFFIEIENPGVLPLRGLQIQTQPDWGSKYLAYLPEKSSFSLNLSGDTPHVEGRFNIRLQWQAIGLSGQENNGIIELAFTVSENREVSRLTDQDLGSSPYVTGSPLEPESGHNVFFGRDVILERIRRQISTHGNVVLLEGNRRAGKTSILKHLEGKDIIPGWLSVYCSLQGVGGASNVAGVPSVEVFRGMARSIATALNKNSIDLPLPDGNMIPSDAQQLGTRRLISKACREGISETDPFVDFSAYLDDIDKILAPQKLGLVLMLDEFDKLQEGIDSGITSPQVPENIRYLIQNNPRFSAILTGSRRLKRLREEYWSALFGLGTSIPVTALDKLNASKVVTEPVRDRLVFAPDAVDLVLQLTAMHPYLLQCLCNKVFDFAIETRSKNITASFIDNCAKELARDNEHFATLWDYAGQGPATGHYRRQLVLMLCTQSYRNNESLSFGSLQELLIQNGVDMHEEALDKDLAYLRELELIDYSGQLDGGEYRLAIPLMAEWIAQQQDINVVLSHARTEAEEENV